MTAPTVAEVVAGTWAGPAPATWTTATAATPGPAEPEVQEGVDPDSVTPGVLGFAVTLAAVLACIPLFLSMTRKIRGVQHRGRLEEAAARAAGEAPSDTPATGAPGAGGADATPAGGAPTGPAVSDGASGDPGSGDADRAAPSGDDGAVGGPRP